MTKLYAQEKRVFDINKVTVVGSPTITSDGVASGFGNSDYLLGNINFDISNTNDWAISGDFTTNSDITTAQYPFSLYDIDGDYSIGLCIQNTKYYFSISDSEGVSVNSVSANPNISANTKYFYKIVYNSVNGYKCYLSQNPKNLTLIASSSDTRKMNYGTTSIRFGRTGNFSPRPFLGSIDLSQFSITVDNELVYSPTKPVYSLERRKEGFDLSKFTVVGTPTITDDGVASGFSNSNYVKFDSSSLLNSTNYSIIFSFISSNITAQKTLINNFIPRSDLKCALITNANKFLLFLGDGTVSYNIANGVAGKTILKSNTKYYVKISFNGSKYTLHYSTDNQNWIEDISVTSNLFANWTEILALGNHAYWPAPQNESFDLKDISITVDGKEVFTGAKEKFYAMRGN